MSLFSLVFGSRSVSRWGALGLLGGVIPLSLISCQQQAESADVTSLRRSSEVTFFCLGPDGEGAPLERCPQGPSSKRGAPTVAAEGYELHALVPQSITAEVAVIRVTGANARGDSTGKVLDADPSNPGVTHLRVGKSPVDIVTTPGGRAHFVGVAEVGKPGIYALPTKCIFDPALEEEEEKRISQRDLTSWPACSLSSAPGEMVVLVDPADEQGGVRATCGGAYEQSSSHSSLDPEEARECAVDLGGEKNVLGRRKLLVSLPEEGKLVVLDAQNLLDRDPGSYAPCEIESEVILQTDVPERVVQPLPDDMVVEGCSEPLVEYGPFPGPFQARPAGLSLQGGLLVVGDQGSPLVHRVDVTDPCSPVEQDPLVATSYLNPTRVVTTNRVALSPVTPEGKQYVYAIDEIGEKTAGVLMFDVSADSISDAPLVRPWSSLMPLEPPDRIEFLAAAKDVVFALSDEPESDSETGNASFGVRCDPDPALGGDEPGARYRSAADYTEGARPRMRRGLFAYVLLSNAQLSVVDVDDFDAACRRPARLNPAASLNFQGCSDDPTSPEFYTSDGSEDGVPTVTNELSCRAVVPHRARSGNLLLTSESGGTLAPSLRSFARLSRAGRGLAVGRTTPEGRKNPIMLGVDFDNPQGGEPLPAQVYVGNVLRLRGASTNELLIDPARAEQASLVLPWVEPRAYPSSEIATVTYEGELGEVQEGALFEKRGSGWSLVTEAQALFCDGGVQDVELTRELGARQFGLEGEALSRFAERHADYVQIVNELLPEEDLYWQKEGAACAGPQAFSTCDSLFGDGLGEELLASRDLRITRAYQNRLEVEPRFADGESADERIANLSCCFPHALNYRIRAGHQWIVRGEMSGFRHSVKAVPSEEGDEFVCARDCSPLKAGQDGRVFELSNSHCSNPDPELTNFCGVGPRTADDLVCVYDGRRGAIQPGAKGSECVFNSLTRRFAIYRGLEPSRRGMAFGFEVMGGFATQSIALSSNTSQVLPVAMNLVPSFGQLGVVDSQSRGLLMIDLRTTRLAASFF